MSTNLSVPQENTLKIKHCVELLTVVTVSSKPVNRTDIGNVPYINEVFLQPDINVRHDAFLEAIKKVKTPFVAFINEDDKFDSDVIFPPEGKAISYGDLTFNESWSERKTPTGQFSKKTNIQFPYNIRRAILRTEFVEPILKITANKSIDTEAVLYYAMAVVHGHHYDSKLKIVWNKFKDDVFKQLLYPVKEKTSEYLSKHTVVFKELIERYNYDLDSKALKPIENFKNLLTIITLSKEPCDRQDLAGLDYINHVSIIEGMGEYFLAIKTTVRKVKTPFLIFVDSDDPVPERIVLPSENAGIVYGDFFIKYNKVISRIKSGPFTEEAFFKNMLMMHKPIYDTKKIRRVVEKLPIIDYCTQPTVNYFVAKAFGAEYNKQLVILWDRGNSLGMHKVTEAKFPVAIEFLQQNKERLLEAIIPKIQPEVASDQT